MMDGVELLSPLSTETEIKNLSGYPRLKPAYILKINIGASQPIGTVGSGQDLTHIETSSGSLTTAEGYEHKVEGQVVYGADWLLSDQKRDYAYPNVKLIIKTDDGVVLNSGWTGVARWSKPILDMWADPTKLRTFPFGISTTIHTFETGDSKYKHLERKIWVGNGRFVINDDKSVTVESRISEVVASCDMD